MSGYAFVIEIVNKLKVENFYAQLGHCQIFFLIWLLFYWMAL